MSSRKESLKTVSEHLQELRRLLIQPIIIMIVVACLAFWQSHSIIELIQKPLSQTLYYSSPIGGFSFVFSVAILCGLLVSLPLFVRSIIKFLEPVMPKMTNQRMLLYLASSIILALSGVLCGYLISLPSALNFLNGFETSTLKPLIAADQYLNFALIYLAGFALLFQIPLIILIINRIKPLKPSRLMKYQKYVVAGSFIFAAILTPTPDALNQLIFAAPMIILYEISIVLVWLVNKLPNRLKQVRKELKEELKLSLPHPIGAVYMPQPVAVRIPVQESRKRPIDVILSSQLVF